MPNYEKTIAINTGGGDCPGLNAVIRAIVKRATLQLNWRVIGIEDSFDGILADKMRVRELTRQSIAGALTKGGTLLGTTNRGNPFAYDYGTGELEDRSQRIADRLQDMGCDGLVALGGDGSMAICHQLSQTTGIKVVGVPKTIDNDLKGTDITFGFNSAVEFATLAVDRLHSTAESHDRIMILEVMGRDAGFIALNAGVAGGADAILIPEVRFNLEAVVDKIQERHSIGRHFSLIVVAEGAQPSGGTKLYNEFGGDVLRLGGVGRYVAEQLHEMTGFESRYTVLGHLQRGGIPTAFDRVLSTRLGNHAVDLVAKDAWNRLVVIHGGKVDSIPLEDAVSSTKTVDLNCDLVHAARGVGIVFGDEK